ncbi:hypothetical protein QBC34DRAFT_466062 [Podospora aff. communis PSN243]|uniref:Uncharacterized protein n=1 Tax=Podospora aff. communis PSN243 TaxID=3040156 RepID=A0AAV9GI69_9PEZI|nr:hypothetical protein QBC34DRAFT_466062 [Podospora aff. communis PSN243]
MFPRVPPAARVALRHRKGALFSILTTSLLYLLHLTTTPPLPPISTTLLPLNNTPPPSSSPRSFLLPPPIPPPPTFPPGNTSSPSSPSLSLVIAHTTSESPITWIHDPIPSHPSQIPISSLFTPHLYTTDSLLPLSELHTPTNKGRESLAYLTHIIDSYTVLDDVTLFLHAHRSSWHDDAFGLDTPTALARMNITRVRERGYVSLRCGWEPGCPAHLKGREGRGEMDWGKPEEGVVGDAWGELFGGEVPEVLSQPCCAQFAVTKERVWERGLEFYTGVRDWVLRTELEDEISGRVMEYLYQDIWTGDAVHCPDEHECYCQGYGICFDSDQKYHEYVDKKNRWHELNDQVLDFINDVTNRFDAADVLALADKLDRGESLDGVVGGDENANSDEKTEESASDKGAPEQGNADPQQAEGQDSGQLSGQVNEHEGNDPSKQQTGGQVDGEGNGQQHQPEDNQDNDQKNNTDESDGEEAGRPPEQEAEAENVQQDGKAEENNQQDGQTQHPDAQPPDQQTIPPPDQDQNKEFNPEQLLQVVELSRELRVLGTWLSDQENQAKNGGKPL